MPVADRLRHLAGLEIFRGLPGRRRDRGFDQRNVGDAAFAVRAGADQACERRVGRKQRAEHVGGLHARPHRHLARRAGDRQHAGKRLDDQVDAGAAAVRPGLAEARHRRVDDLRIDRLQMPGAEPHFLQRAGPVGLQEHVGLRGELAHDLLRLRRFQVEHEAALVAVERGEAHALAVPDRRRGAAHVAAGRLDLDDVGAHVGRAACRTTDRR